MRAYISFRLLRGRVSLLAHRRTILLTSVLLLVCIAAVVISTGTGSMSIAPMDVIRSLMGVGAEEHMMVIQAIRLPRILIAVLVGASLAASGAILQGIIRNPLASPDIIGITGGASVAAVAFLNYGAGVLSIRYLPAAAMLGAVAVFVVLYLLSWKNGVKPIRLILVGVGLSSLLSGMTTMMIIFNPNNEASQAYFWLTGSIYGTKMEHVYMILPWTLIFIPLAWMLARHINISQLGDDIAGGAGSSVQRNRLFLLLISVALAASAVAVGGGIGFVGLIAPHMARKLVGASFGSVLPVASLLGAIIVVLADLAGRMLLHPLDIPVGVFTSAVGAPFFIYLLYTRRNSR
ncbi:MAG: transport system permease [Paenibacillus sp.]|nr:transport system permease [Paenibacillus sp.]